MVGRRVSGVSKDDWHLPTQNAAGRCL